MRPTLILVLFLTQILFPQNNIQFSIQQFDSLQLKKHLEILGSDLFEGRGTGTKGGELAASYIAEVFEKNGLIPIGDNNTFYQNVPMHGTSNLNNSKLVLNVEGENLNLQIGKDYLLSSSGEQTFIPQPLEIIFIGYGIIAPEFDHNDYLDKDVNGKIVAMLSGEPESDNNEYFYGNEPTIYSHLDVKHRVAISRGAAGTILIPTDFSEENWNRLKIDYSFEDVKLSYNASNSFGIILNPRVAKKIIENIDGLKSGAVTCKDLHKEKCSLKFEGDFFVRDFKSPNVVGLIENPNKKSDEYIIVSAHYDHLGVGESVDNDKIYNGILDNAIGVSAILEIARVISKHKDKLNKSVIFDAVTGEEKGLLGSTYYTDHPIKPLYKTVANVNVDGLAFIDDFSALVGIGSELSNLNEILSTTATKMNLTLNKLPGVFYSEDGFNRSDQIAFAKAGIPSILILDYPEYKNLSREESLEKIIYYNTNIYHTPKDDLNIDINYFAAIKHTTLIANFILDLSVTKKKIEWNENIPYKYVRLQTKAEKR